jgi:tetratricopeptide (TPR) repeat protein
MTEALGYLQQGQFAAAEPCLDRLLELDPADVSARYNRALCALGQDRQSEAVTMLDALIVAHPDYAFGLAQRAWLYAQKSELDEAQTLLDKAFAIDEVHVAALACMTDVQIRVYITRRQVSKAIETLNLLASVEPNLPLVQEWQQKFEPIRRHWHEQKLQPVG